MAGSEALAAASSALQVFGGLMGFLNSGPQAAIQESKGRMLRREADLEAERFAEEARAFLGEQTVGFIKSGVRLEGSPLAVLDETILTTSENISAIRARGRSQEFDFFSRAENIRQQGRMALLTGVAKGGSSFASFQARRSAKKKKNG